MVIFLPRGRLVTASSALPRQEDDARGPPIISPSRGTSGGVPTRTASTRRGGLATGTEIRRPADEAGDPGLGDRPTALRTGLPGPAIHGVLGQEPPLQAQDGAVARVEARPLGADRLVQHGGDRPVQAP